MASALKTIEEAREFMLSHARAIEEVETVALAETLGRVLAESLTSRVDLPPWDNSAMDGYALNSADLVSESIRLPVSQRIPAGAVGERLAPGTAARIFTGAPVPPGADTVVIQEHCHRDGDDVIINRLPAAGSNVRRAGEDLRRGQEILQSGTRMGPQHLGLAASVGIAEVPVYRRVKVALFSSGDELVLPGESLGPGQIFNSNQYTLSGLLRSLGCEVIDLGMVEDTLDATCEALQAGAEQADLVLASGGVSVGEEDHVKPAVEKLGSLDLWKVAIRPGKPLAFGHIGTTPFIGAPGNPVSLFITFCLFARPFILKLQGITRELWPTPISAPAAFDRPKPDTRREFARARLDLDESGQARISIAENRSSAALSSLTWANGLAVLPEHQTLSQGDMVEFISFSELLR